ncbi:arylsulfatase [Bradyrhizobium liaoningense]|uniref:arylsulfatase n=1 Tax=Bradyrhizobium liaoningense TaxID=43992 RepID=UPI001BA87088|nr:arylsulfatase [Bradyrhizobium liaoningense]MBR0742081.1 arylsulfatase [Bradyrhizobium liaoningense]
MHRSKLGAGVALAALLALNPGSSSAQTSALSAAVRINDYSEPTLSFPEQERDAQRKLDANFARTKKRPNILWLVVDDMGYGDPGCYGGGEAIGAATPNMDRLAREGLKLTSTYSQPTCTPTRSAMMLGRLPARTGLTRPILAGDTVRVNPWDGETSVAKVLADAGYHTVLTGKWHTGELKGMRPFDVGFDEFQGYYASQKELTQQVDARRYPDLVLDPDMAGRIKAAGGKVDMYYGRKGEEETVVEKTTSVEQFAEADQTLAKFTIDRIKADAKGDKPFFIAHNFMRVHADNHPSKAFRGKSTAKYQYKDNVVEVDALIGQIVGALDEAGIADNTFVFITSDNGPQLDAWPDGGYTPFRGAKGSPWEGAVRVPGIAYWKGVIKPGRESSGLFDLMDLFNTSVRLGGALDRIPSDRYIDGIDQTSFLLADEGKSNREKVFIWVERNLAAVRMYGYKIMTKVVQEQAQWLNIDMTTVSNVGLAPWLFNLYIDPKEQYPVGHRMNAWLASMVAELKAEQETFKKYPPKEVGLEQ